MSSEPEALAGVYAATFIVGGPEGSHAFTNDARFIEWLRQVADFNRQHGMRALMPVSIRDMTLSPLHTLAAVTWGARFEKTGDRVIEFEIVTCSKRQRTIGESSRISPTGIRTLR